MGIEEDVQEQKEYISSIEALFSIERDVWERRYQRQFPTDQALVDHLDYSKRILRETISEQEKLKAEERKAVIEERKIIAERERLIAEKEVQLLKHEALKLQASGGFNISLIVINMNSYTDALRCV